VPANASRAVHTVSLLILGGALLFDLPQWFGFIGLALGLAALAMPAAPAR